MAKTRDIEKLQAENSNIAFGLNKTEKGKELLKTIGQTVVEDYNTDKGSRSVLDRRMKIWFKLYSGLPDIKTKPWANSSNVIIPILATACQQSHARAFEALLPAKGIVKYDATDGQSINVAKRCQKFQNWQLNKQMPEWRKDTDKALLLTRIYGTVIKKTYYDHLLKRVVSRMISLEDFVAPYGVKDLADAPRKTHVITTMSVNDIKKRGLKGVWINTGDISEGSATIDDPPAAELRRESDKSTGLSPNSDTKDINPVLLEQHRLWDLDGDGIEEPYCVTVDKYTSKVLSIQSLTYIDQEGIEKVYDYFTVYNFLPNADSWMGLGFGHILEHPNRAINSLTNQLIDAGTLSNISGGFINKSRNLKVGKLKIKMGKYTEVDLPGDDIRKSIYEFQFKQPSAVLHNMLVMLQEYAQKLSSTTDSMQGQMPPSDTAATTVLTIMEQGMKVQSTIHRRQHTSLGEELTKIAILNTLYLDEALYLKVQDSTSSEMQEPNISGRFDFGQSIDAVPVSDPSITSRAEKLIKSTRMWELLKDDPDIRADKEAMYELKKNLAEAMEIPNVDKIIKKPQPPPPPPDLRPEQEEAEFLAERNVAPLETQDHEYHLISHNVFKDEMAETPKDSLIELSPQGKKLLEAHIKETQALYYLQLEGEPNVEQPSNAIGVGNEGLDTQPVYSGAPEIAGGTEADINGGIDRT